jgi:predicted transcriptional regulator
MTRTGFGIPGRNTFLELTALLRHAFRASFVSTIQEIKTAIATLSPRDKALLAAELFATNDPVDDAELEAALQRGLKDVEAGRVHPIEQVKETIPRWTSKS